MVNADFEYGIASDSVMIVQNKKVKGIRKCITTRELSKVVI